MTMSERTPDLGCRTILVKTVRPERPLGELRGIAVHQRRKPEVLLWLGVCRKLLNKADGTTVGDVTMLSPAEDVPGHLAHHIASMYHLH